MNCLELEMSRAYRVSVSGSVERIVHVEDGVAAPLELLPILAKERMREILAKELEGRGFTREDGVARRDEGNGVTVEVDLDAGNVTVRAESSKDVKIERTRTGTVAEERVAQGRAALQRQLDAELEQQVAATEQEMREQATARLERKLKDLKQELDRAVNRVTAEALKEKARSMGEIEELHEDNETGELTIKVRV
jgi:hypothetical protein